MSHLNFDTLKLMANSIRALSMDAVQKANSGHSGMPMGMADIAAVLYRHFLNFDPKNPTWESRDRFILSNGHGSMLQYSLLHLTGYNVSLDDIKNFRQLNSNTPGHPEFGYTDGVETTTGPLGQGIANAVGMALALKIKNAHTPAPRLPKVYVTVGDGCLMEGISHEACELAAHWELDNLVVLFDDNGITIDGKTEITLRTNNKARFEAYGFNVIEANGHDYAEIAAALEKAQNATGPVVIFFKTEIGFGSPTHAGTSTAHGAITAEDEVKATRAKIGWDYDTFEIPEAVYAAWAEAAEHGKRHSADVWPVKAADVSAAIAKLEELKKTAATDKPTLATRKASGNCIAAFAPELPQFVSGSADLSGSNNTLTGGDVIDSTNFSGTYIHYGVREHAMGAIMNGLALEGLISAGGTFLTFTDYMREPMRLAALMHQRTIFVMTHDSIGVGEDGPTHQPVEQVAMLRATPMLNVFRPADQVEAAEAWMLALQQEKTPSVMVLTRQNLPAVRTAHTDENLTAKGAYILADSEKDQPDAILMATGSEVHLALEAKDILKTQGVDARVVSMPCWELFDAQDQNYRDSVLPPTVRNRVAIEAACQLGWERYIGLDGAFIGMQGFGASAPADELYKHFGITAQAAADAVINLSNTNMREAV